MRLFILGATGGIGRHLLRIGLDRGHHLTAFARSPGKVPAPRPAHLTVLPGDLFDPDALASALRGHDAVLSAFGPTTLRTTTLRRDFGRALAAALRQSDVRRVQLVSAAFLFPHIGFVGEVLKPTVFRFMAPDMAAMERQVMHDDLDWTILRPPRLTNGPLTRRYRTAVNELPPAGRTISRADVADFMIREAESPSHTRQIVGLAR